ncbi:hypothetical protein QFC21_004926 [Naganishia friedmannii]|uniref:Uncharacterized protein n=1 Tax=Naganishia friedmannii TaxID=89922 RepID=A0ACC2VEA4_9TREE|nr:hypothetical protein QFC21_004926 [Naganishia friedmannii]
MSSSCSVDYYNISPAAHCGTPSFQDIFSPANSLYDQSLFGFFSPAGPTASYEYSSYNNGLLDWFSQAQQQWELQQGAKELELALPLFESASSDIPPFNLEGTFDAYCTPVAETGVWNEVSRVAESACIAPLDLNCDDFQSPLNASLFTAQEQLDLALLSSFFEAATESTEVRSLPTNPSHPGPARGSAHSSSGHTRSAGHPYARPSVMFIPQAEAADAAAPVTRIRHRGLEKLAKKDFKRCLDHQFKDLPREVSIGCEACTACRNVFAYNRMEKLAFERNTKATEGRLAMERLQFLLDILDAGYLQRLRTMVHQGQFAHFERHRNERLASAECAAFSKFLKGQ